MPRVTPQAELDQLVALIAAQPDGLGIDAIQSQGNSLTRRTLQRRLAARTQSASCTNFGPTPNLEH